jgi:hypothetical protein
MSPGAIHVNACRLLKNAKVALRIAEFHARAEVETLLTLEQHMEQLKSLREMAKEARQFSAANSAEVKRGELMRFYVKQVESAHVNEFEHMSVEELEAIIRERYVEIEALKAGSAVSPKLLTSNRLGHKGGMRHRNASGSFDNCLIKS